MSQTESTQARCAAWALNFDHDARRAGFFSSCKGLLPPGPATSRPSSPARPSRPSRVQIVRKIWPFTSLRIADSIASKVENASSSRRAWASFSSATLIRSGGWFFTQAASVIAFAAILRALPAAYLTPSRLRTSSRCDSAVRAVAHTGMTDSSASSGHRQRRT